MDGKQGHSQFGIAPYPVQCGAAGGPSREARHWSNFTNGWLPDVTLVGSQLLGLPQFTKRWERRSLNGISSSARPHRCAGKAN